MKTHPLDPTALVSGLLFALSGLAIIADQSWDSIDVTAFVGAGVGVLGVFLVVVLLARQLREGSTPPDQVSSTES